MAHRLFGTLILSVLCASLSSAGPTAANRESAVSATVSVTFRTDVMFERPIVGLAPWLWPPKESSRWDELRPLLEYLNLQAYHFQVGSNVYAAEIERGPEPVDSEGLAGRLHRRADIPDGDTFGGFLRAMRFARDSGASIHLITARPVARFGSGRA